MNEVEAAMRIVQEQPECRIYVFSGSTHGAELHKDAAAKGYSFPVLPKPTPPADLLRMLSDFGFEPEPFTK